jgi:hypothetical protein
MTYKVAIPIRFNDEDNQNHVNHLALIEYIAEARSYHPSSHPLRWPLTGHLWGSFYATSSTFFLFLGLAAPAANFVVSRAHILALAY